MKTYLRTAGIMLSASLLTLASCHKKEAAPKEGIPEIEVAEATTDSVMLHKTYPGFLGADKAVKVVGQVDGMLLTKNYESGKFVKKGQVLFTIDPTLYRDAVQRAEAQLASAISQRDYAKSHFDAVTKALEAEAVSKMEVLSAESAYNQAEADIKDCRAALNTARTNLAHCTVTAPLSGYISDSFISEGNYVNGSGEPVALAEIYDNCKVYAIFEIEDSQYEKMVGRDGGMGDPVYRNVPLIFQDSLRHEYTADLFYEAPSVSQTTGTLQLKGVIKNIDNELKSGMYVTVNLPYGERHNAVLVKDASIGTDQLGRYVYLVNDSNKVVYTPVDVSEVYQDSLRIITKGVKAGDRYVTKALLTVRNGETVKPVISNKPGK